MMNHDLIKKTMGAMTETQKREFVALVAPLFNMPNVVKARAYNGAQVAILIEALIHTADALTHSLYSEQIEGEKSEATKTKS